jgi:hypothetical protein
LPRATPRPCTCTQTISGASFARAPSPYKPQAHRQNTVVITAPARSAGAYACGGYRVIVDGIIGTWFIEDFREMAETRDTQIHYVVVRCEVTTKMSLLTR